MAIVVWPVAFVNQCVAYEKREWGRWFFREGEKWKILNDEKVNSILPALFLTKPMIRMFSQLGDRGVDFVGGWFVLTDLSDWTIQWRGVEIGETVVYIYPDRWPSRPEVKRVRPSADHTPFVALSKALWAGNGDNNRLFTDAPTMPIPLVVATSSKIQTELWNYEIQIFVYTVMYVCVCACVYPCVCVGVCICVCLCAYVRTCGFILIHHTWCTIAHAKYINVMSYCINWIHITGKSHAGGGNGAP